jgi:hypothetical protein
MHTNLTTRKHERFNRWMVRGFYAVSLGLAMPLAIFTCNGLLGLLVHGIALSGMASLLDGIPQDKASSKHSIEEGEAV